MRYLVVKNSLFWSREGAWCGLRLPELSPRKRHGLVASRSDLQPKDAHPLNEVTHNPILICGLLAVSKHMTSWR
jgi:hypothetical protein